MQVSIASETITQIADHLDMGMKCFYHIPTGEFEYYPDDLKCYGGFDEENWQEAISKVKKNYREYMVFEGMEVHESFGLMKDFVAMIAEEATRRQFEDAIANRKPFQNFKQLLLDYPDLLEQWFVYKNKLYIEFVESQVDAYNLSQLNDAEQNID
jgi:hypothetical protein